MLCITWAYFGLRMLSEKYCILPVKIFKSWKFSNIWRCSNIVLDLQNCSVAFMDARNGFLTKFRIEMVIQKKSQLFFSSKKKYFLKMKFEKKTFFGIFFCSFSKNIFFRRKKKVEKKIGLPYRCGILSGIHFWHP